MKAENFVGKRFGRLVVLEEHYGKRSQLFCDCLCDCGNRKTIRRDSLISGKTQSCGCLAVDRHPTKHGYVGTRIYRIWCNMKSRCYAPNQRFYKYYGGRGISVCDEWKNDFKSFCDWAMRNGYSDELTIDRIDVNKGYCPSNCRWVSMAKQTDNRTNTKYLTLNGVTKSITEWGREINIPRKVLYWRTTHGWSDERTLTTPLLVEYRREKRA